MSYIADKVAQLEAHDKIIVNAVIIAGIVFISTLGAQYPPDAQSVYQAVIGFSLALMTQLKTITSDREPPKLGMLL